MKIFSQSHLHSSRRRWELEISWCPPACNKWSNNTPTGTNQPFFFASLSMSDLKAGFQPRAVGEAAGKMGVHDAGPAFFLQAVLRLFGDALGELFAGASSNGALFGDVQTPDCVNRGLYMEDWRMNSFRMLQRYKAHRAARAGEFPVWMKIKIDPNQEEHAVIDHYLEELAPDESDFDFEKHEKRARDTGLFERRNRSCYGRHRVDYGNNRSQIQNQQENCTARQNLSRWLSAASTTSVRGIAGRMRLSFTSNKRSQR